MWCFYDRSSLVDSWQKVASAGGLDYCVCKCGRSWYTYSIVWLDGTPYSFCMAGFSTRKVAREAAVHWSERGDTVESVWAGAARSGACYIGSKRATFVDGRPVIPA